MKLLRLVALLLTLVGSAAWLLWGFFVYDFIAEMFGGDMTRGTRVLAVLIGLSTLWVLAGRCGRVNKCCGKTSCECKGRSCGPDR